MEKNFIDLILDSFDTKDFLNEIKKNNEVNIAVPTGFIPFLLASINESFNIIFIARNELEAESVFESLKSIGKETLYYPGVDVFPFSSGIPSSDKLFDRISTFYKLMTNSQNTVITTMEAILRKIPPVEYFNKSIINVKRGEYINFKEIIEKLTRLGYHREEKVVEIGSFSVRGDIIDLYPPIYDKPVRMEFFENEIESIRFFELETQKSTSEIEELVILPSNEFFIEKERILSEDEKYLGETYIHSHFIRFYDSLSSLIDYSKEEVVLILDESYETIENEIKKKCSSFASDYKKLFYNIEDLMKGRKRVINHRLKEKSNLLKEINSPPTFRGIFSDFLFALENNYLKKNYRVFILIEYKELAERFKHLLSKFEPEIIQPFEKISSNRNVYIVVINYEKGFEVLSKDEKILLLSESDITGKKRLFRKKIRQIESFFEDAEEIKIGDYVVHINYGICIFRGVERINVLGKEKDYILLEFAEKEKLYVPFEQSNLIGKYIGDPNKKVELDSLGTKSWARKKAKVERSIEEFAKSLLSTYAKRMTLKGHSFSRDTIWQKDFEGGFEYIETPDQIKAIEEIKKDMESPRPMNRLLCGDVGFGKTEVAMRAAFKAVMDGKQVAIVAPTTVLVEQHYITFRKRFAPFPIRIEYISRLVNPQKEKEIIEGLKKHSIDIIIGTHKLFSSKIEFHNLGLVIIDEEHKFGVEHKEELKRRYPLVDFLSLSATPIPRTLNMAISSLKDISLIQTPPDMRIPVETYVGSFSPEIVKYAIENELSRDGQVYFVHNTIKHLREYAYLIENLVPSAKVVIAHGRMDEEELEEAFLGFVNGKYNVFVSTAIIDSGLDISNANTIIVSDAHKFGLSQLYQLKGRVGRSKEQAYAYFLYPESKILTESAEKRLYVIQEYTELGAGFNIALKDLEIRGAGNLLGKEQHGNIIAVGYDLYIKLLRKEIEKLKGEEKPEVETLIDLKYNAYIPDFYISDNSTKMEIYKKILSVKSEDEISDLKQELIDRFGSIPDEVDALFEISKLKIIASELGVDSIIEKGSEIEISFSKYSKADIGKVIEMVSRGNGELYIKPHQNNKLFMKSFESSIHIKVKRLITFLSSIKES